MNCKKAQELILTDYLDEEINKEQVDAHIASCKECREFLAVVKKITVEPLEQATKDNLSRDVIWTRIQDEIKTKESDAQGYNWDLGFLSRLKDIIFAPKPVFAMGTCAALIMMVLALNFNARQSQLPSNAQSSNPVIVAEKITDAQTKEIDQDIYLTYYFDQSESAQNYGTSLEEYFL